jgi:hypothetical protein
VILVHNNVGCVVGLGKEKVKSVEHGPDENVESDQMEAALQELLDRLAVQRHPA